MTSVESPETIEASYRLSTGVYLIGSLENGVTVYRQQIRAHNISWALWQLSGQKQPPNTIAIIGAGITGLTAAACLLSLFPMSQVTIFEKRWDLCTLQLGCDTRWLHPKIYDWPAYGSRGPSAQLPVLNWTEGRASDVVRNVRQAFGAYSRINSGRLRIVLGLNYIHLFARERTIRWMGHKVSFDKTFRWSGDPERGDEPFDLIVLASGYQLEASPPLYWQNEHLAQPVLSGERVPYLISGYGDGAIVDLCRLTIAGFRQDTILSDLFGTNLERVEDELHAKLERRTLPYFDFLNSEFFLRPAIDELANRLRRDTKVVLQVGGRTGANRSFPAVFDHSSSFLNKLLLFALHKCGGFSTTFASVEDACSEHAIPESNIIQRHGNSKEAYVRSMFEDPATIEQGLVRIQNRQTATRWWPAGVFPPPGVGP